MRFLPLILSTCILAACGGGGGANSGTATLTPTQKAYESVMLSPNVGYSFASKLPTTATPVDGHYYYDSAASLPKSPLSNGTQRVSGEAFASLASTLDVPSDASSNSALWFVVSGQFHQAASPAVYDVSYPGADVVMSALSADKKTVLYSSLLVQATEMPLSGKIVPSAIPDHHAIPNEIWTNSSLSKANASWQSNSAYLSMDVRYKDDWNIVYSNAKDGNKPLLFQSGTTIQQLIDGDKLVVLDVHYNLTNGKTQTVAGVKAYVANDPVTYSTTYPIYAAFYEMEGNVYAGARYQVTSVDRQSLTVYNKAARASIVAALTF